MSIESVNGKEACYLLGVSSTRLLTHIREKRIKPIGTGRDARYLIADLVTLSRYEMAIITAKLTERHKRAAILHKLAEENQ
jgi:hypothetical protein